MTRPWDDPASDPLADVRAWTAARPTPEARAADVLARHRLATFVETHSPFRAEGGFCAPLSATYTVGRVGFRPLPFWRGWWRRWDAGGPLLGHVTLPRHRLRFPTFTADRGGIRFITPPFEG